MSNSEFENLYHPPLQVRTIADIEAFEKTPIEQRQLPASTYELIRIAANANPDQVAMRYFESGDELDAHISVTRGEAFACVTQVANTLHALGLRADDVVGVLMPIVPEAFYVTFGAEATCVACPINWMLEPEIIVRLLEAAGATALIAYGPHEDIESWQKALQVRLLMPRLRLLIQAGGAHAPGDHIDLTAEMRKHPGDALASGRRFKPTDLASLFHTGGTTGVPKLARHLHGNEVHMAWISAMQYGVRETDVRLCGTPMFHVTGILTNLFMPICRGTPVVLLTANGWRNPSVIRNLWAIVDYFKITSLSMVPSVMSTALNIPLGDSDISSLETTSVGTAPLSVAVANAYQSLTQCRLLEAYGLTEATALSAANPRHGQARIGSIGLRMAYLQMRIAKVDANGSVLRDCASGESGAILIKGPNVFPGYLDEGANAKVFHDGWFDTGDLGYQDEDEYFWITGRAKDLIIRGGNNIDPRMIEEALYAHAHIADAAAVGIPDAHAGELPAAYIVFKEGRELPIGRIKHYAYEAIPERAAVPKNFFVRKELPKSVVGKIQKNLLRIDAVRASQESALKAALGDCRFEVSVRDQNDAGLRSLIRVHSPMDAQARQETLAKIDAALLTSVVPREVEFADA